MLPKKIKQKLCNRNLQKLSRVPIAYGIFLLHFISMNAYTCIFGGGAIRGATYVGVVKALKELNIDISAYVGSSVGAIFASLCSIGYDSSEFQKIMYDFNAFMFKDINFSIGQDFSISKGEIFENWIRECIEKKFYGDCYKKGENPPVTFADIDMELSILATDLATNSRFVFSKKTTPDFEVARAVRISSSFPGLIKPAEIDGMYLVDGDLAKSIPLWKELELDRDNRILEFRLEGNCMNLKSVIDYINSVYSSMSYFCSENIIQTYNSKDMFDYVMIDTKDVLLFDFQITNDQKDWLAKVGYETTMSYFKNNLLQKKKRLLPLYQGMLNSLIALKNLIKSSKVAEIKSLVFDYLCNLSDDYLDMDAILLNDAKKFKSLLFKDMKTARFLPVSRIENKTEHVKALQGLIKKFEFKVCEMETYIKEFSK